VIVLKCSTLIIHFVFRLETSLEQWRKNVFGGG
jgi:hypothetical protein